MIQLNEGGREERGGESEQERDQDGRESGKGEAGLQYCGVLASTGVTLRSFLGIGQELFTPKHFDSHRVGLACPAPRINGC
ncbi:hypothetical protein EYF80_003352 [Liparis tanakae]|uniref:Uncharacterized protein n=1 Tax=Liparis tanakae TaxID=230148 RepID=A0A4Z2J8C5_9TELE|nr:hypothetical protein EYF80_003352 [Liparis tanakae]